MLSAQRFTSAWACKLRPAFDNQFWGDQTATQRAHQELALHWSLLPVALDRWPHSLQQPGQWQLLAGLQMAGTTAVSVTQQQQQQQQQQQAGTTLQGCSLLAALAAAARLVAGVAPVLTAPVQRHGVDHAQGETVHGRRAALGEALDPICRTAEADLPSHAVALDVDSTCWLGHAGNK
jgi:hypothetical protein